MSEYNKIDCCFDCVKQFNSSLCIDSCRTRDNCDMGWCSPGGCKEFERKVSLNIIKGEDNMKKLQHDLLTSKYTEVYHEKNFKFNAPHYFEVWEAKGKESNKLATINFQEGAIKEVGINGVNNEDLISMVICRLEHFQKSDFACKENEIAITKLEEALLWLRKRTMGRENRGVEGKYIK